MNVRFTRVKRREIDDILSPLLKGLGMFREPDLGRGARRRLEILSHAEEMSRSVSVIADISVQAGTSSIGGSAAMR